MAAPTVYRSTDTSAPALTGESGKLIALLDACLVDGYGAKAAAGWTKPYSATNYAAYRQGGGLEHFLWVHDVATQMSRVVGYVSMTGILDGIGPFPTEAQVSGGLYVRKSVTANTTARPWILFATDRSFYLIVFGGSTTFGTYGGGDAHLGFGQLHPAMTGDAKHSFLVAATDTSTSSTSATLARQVLASHGNTAGHYLATSYTQTGTAVVFTCRPLENLYSQTSASGVGGITYPDPVSGSLCMAPMAAQEASLVLRGIMPGLYSLAHPMSGFANFDTFSGRDDLAGEDFLIVLTGSYGLLVQTSGGW